MTDFKEKYLKYKTKYIQEKIKQLGGDCNGVCKAIAGLDVILIHGHCLDGALVAYLLRKYCNVKDQLINFIAPGNYIVDTIQSDPTNIKFGLYDLALPDMDQDTRITCGSGKKNVLMLDNKEIVHIVDHHFTTERYKKCMSSIVFDKFKSTSNIIWTDMTATNKTAGSLNLKRFISVVNMGDRGQLGLDQSTIDDFLIYIGLQKILDIFLTNKSQLMKSPNLLQQYNDNDIDPILAFTDVLDHIIRTAVIEHIQIIGLFEILNIYMYLSGKVSSYPGAKIGKLYGPIKSNITGTNTIIDSHTLFLPKRSIVDTTIAQVAGKTIVGDQKDPINYIVIYSSKSKSRWSIRDVSVNNTNKMGNAGNAYTISISLNPSDAGGHEKASSVAVDDELQKINLNSKELKSKYFELDDGPANRIIALFKEAMKEPIIYKFFTLFQIGQMYTPFSEVMAHMEHGFREDSFDSFIFNTYINEGVHRGLQKESCGSIESKGLIPTSGESKPTGLVVTSKSFVPGSTAFKPPTSGESKPTGLVVTSKAFVPGQNFNIR